MPEPNFFILGAPKSGTTALSAYLSEHPDVFFSPVKEPLFFATDFATRHIRNEEDYAALFTGALEGMSIGEASTHYLESCDAVPNILARTPSARFIVMLRNPLEMAPAMHAQAIWDGIETELDFAAAWKLNDIRRSGRLVPIACEDAKLVCYRDACMLGSFMQRLLAGITPEQLLVILFDDFRRSPAASYRQALAFLDLPEDDRSGFPVINSRKQVRRPWLQRALFTLGAMKRQLGISRGFGIHERLKPLIFSETGSGALPHAAKEEMRDAFRDDVALLSTLLKRDLDHWLS